MGIITISREFGSGGREIGKRLADEMGYAYYDKEIVTAIAEKHELDEHYVAYALEGSMFRNYPVHFGRTFSYTPTLVSNDTKLFVEQNKLLRELAAKGNCVIVGRAADVSNARQGGDRLGNIALSIYSFTPTCPPRSAVVRNEPIPRSIFPPREWKSRSSALMPIADGITV